MELYIFNTNRELVGIVESFEYLRWTRRYSQCGSFELKAIATQENAELLKEGNIIWKNDDEEAGLLSIFPCLRRIRIYYGKWSLCHVLSC